MKSIYITTHNSKIYLKENQLIVEKSNTEKFEYPIKEIDKVVVTVGINLTSPVLSALLFHKIPTYFLSKTGKYFGKLDGITKPTIQARLRQYEFYSSKLEDHIKLELVRKTVDVKLHNSYVCALRWCNSHDIESRSLELTYTNINKIVENCGSIDKLRGYEGNFARIYFSYYRQFLKSKLGFSERNRNPPKDPINSLLSFGYTLLAQDIMSAIEQAGLEPYLGYFHTIHYSNPSLVYDMMEDFRANYVDSIVLDIVNHGSLSFEDFTKGENGGILINDEIKRKLITKYEQRRDVTYKVEGTEISYKEIFLKKVNSYLGFLLTHNVESYYCFENK